MDREALGVLQEILVELKKLTETANAAKAERDRVIAAKMAELRRPMDGTPWGRSDEDRRTEALVALAAAKSAKEYDT